MLKIFPPNIAQSKVNISQKISEPYKGYLTQARGVIDNYLKDKECIVTISNCPLEGSDYLEICALDNAKKSLSRISVLKESDSPFLRKIYKAIEIVTNKVIVIGR